MWRPGKLIKRVFGTGKIRTTEEEMPEYHEGEGVLEIKFDSYTGEGGVKLKFKDGVIYDGSYFYETTIRQAENVGCQIDVDWLEDVNDPYEPSIEGSFKIKAYFIAETKTSEDGEPLLYITIKSLKY